MSDFFDRPDPQQAVPRDLDPLRQAILQAILGSGGQRKTPTATGWQTQGQTDGGNGGLDALLGFINQDTPGGDVLGPLRESFDSRLNDQIGEMNASTPGRFSSANIYQQGQLRQRSLQDYNTLAAQVLDQGRSRQLQAIMGLLGPAMGPTFGGPFTQGASGFDNLLGLIGTVGQFTGGGSGGSSSPIGSGGYGFGI